MVKKIILLFLVIMSTLSCERVFDSPFDPESSNYQEFIVETGSLDFGSNNLYSGSSKNVKLYNTTNNKIIVSINSSSINFKGDTSLTISADSYVDLRVYFMPTEAKTYTGTITADAGTLGKKTISLTGAGKTAITSDGLVAYYNFTEENPLIDKSGNGNNLTNYNGATFSSEGVNLDGSNDYLRTQINNFNSNELTLFAYAKKESGETGRIVQYGPDGYNNGDFIIHTYYKDIEYYGYNGSWTQTSKFSIDYNEYYLFLMTYKDGVIKGYKNGEYIGQISKTSYTYNNRYLWISRGNYPQYFDGVVKYVGFYDKALSQAEITSLYNNGGVPTTSSNIFTVSNTAFGYTPKSKSSTQNITIKNNTNFPISVTNITYPSCFSGASSINVGASDSTTLAVTFAPTEANKNYRDTLKLITDIGVTYKAVLTGTSASGLVAYYSFDGNANDQSGNGNNGTVNGATYTSSGKVNGAYSFDGSNDYITASTNTNTSSGFSFSAWFTWDGYGSNVASMIGSINGHGVDNGSFDCIVDPGNVLRARAFGEVYGTYPIIASSTNWHHVVLSVGSDGAGSMYVDGNLVGTSSTGIENFVSSILCIGRYSNSSQHYFNGKIDEVYIYSRALTQSEVTSLYNAGNN